MSSPSPETQDIQQQLEQQLEQQQQAVGQNQAASDKTVAVLNGVVECGGKEVYTIDSSDNFC